jgi:hypothetical protein
MKRGGYATPKDVVLAGLALLEQHDRVGDFAEGQLDALLVVADAEIARGEVVDGEEVFRELRGLGTAAKRRRRTRAG